MDPTCGLGDKFRDLALNLIWEQLLYLVHYHRNIEQLNEQFVKLTDERSSIQHQIDEANNNVRKIEERVCHWMLKVDEASEQVRKFQEEVSQVRAECSTTSCPKPWLRYKLSKRAKEMAQEVAEICKQRKFDRVAYDVPPQTMPELTNRESNEEIGSRVQIRNQIMEALRNPSVNMIGLCGLGGVGKTTIAKDVEKEEKNQKMFGIVIMATVSQEMNIGQIQDQIVEKLGMQLSERTEEVRACRLYERLKQEKNMLLILDDLWEELDLGKVGIPFVDVEKYGKNNEGCKILLTSRNEKLLLNRMKCQKVINMGVLLETEAWELFKSIAKLSIESSSPDLKSIATEIVQKCGGLPLAIATAAKALEGNNLDEFKDYLTRLRNPLMRTLTGIKEVDTILKLSYDHLSQENKSIFLLAAMLSHDPSIEDLLMYSVGLDYLERIDNMEDAHARISAIVRKLKSVNLFLDSYSSHCVTIHDVFRDVALPIAFDELHAYIERNKTLNDWPDEDMLERYEGICLQEIDINVDLPEELHGPRRLEFFMLNSTKLDLTIPSMFFKSSKELKLLAFIKVQFSSLPSLIFLQKLKALCLHSCLLEDITEVKSLKKLKVLSLAYSEIQRLPIELAELTSLQMLNLSHCSKLKVIPHKVLSSLKKLEVLYINSFDQWKVEGSSETNENASLDELKDLPISSLDIRIPNVSMLPEDLFSHMNLERYQILIGKHWGWGQVINHETSKILKLELERSIHLTRGIRKLLEGVEDLCLYGSNGPENVLYSHDGRGFPHLRHLQIECDDDIKYVVLNSARHEVAFPILESLKLQNLHALEKLCEGPNAIKFPRLHTLEMENLPTLIGDLCIKDRVTNNASNKLFKSLFNKVLLPKLEILKLSNLNCLIPLIWNGQLSDNSFSKLRTLIVKRCGFVKLMPLHVLKSLNNLEELEIRDCDLLEMVLDCEDLNDYQEMKSSSLIVPLKKLQLQHLPKLKNVWSNHSQESLFNNKVLLPKLEVLELFNLKSLIPFMWGDQLSPNSFNNLRKLIVTSCGFVKLLPFHVLKYLNNLEELQVRYCDMLEIVFDFEDLNDHKGMESSTVVVPLKELGLSNLPKLKNVWSNDHQGIVSFPSLRNVYADGCVNLTSMFPAFIAKGMLRHLEELQIYTCGIDVIVAKDHVSESVAPTFEFPKLTNLQLSELPKLRNFYPQRHTLESPNLQCLFIGCCDELKIFEKEALSSSEILEEESMLNSKYPLLSHDKVIHSLEELTLVGKQVEMIGSGQFLMDHFPKVKLLHLSLEKLPTFLYGSLQRSFPNSKELQLSGDIKEALGGNIVSVLAASFSKLTLKQISIMPPLSLVSSSNITHLEVTSSHRLTTLMLSSIAQSLVHLTHLSIIDCDQIEEIIMKQEGEDDEDKKIFFDKMECLKLESLPRLKRFCGHNWTFKFPLLECVTIIECDRLITFCPGAIHAPRLQSVQVNNYKLHKDTIDLNDTIQCRFTIKEVISTIKSMALNAENITMKMDVFPIVMTLFVESFLDEGVTFPYSSLERFPCLLQLFVKHSSFEEIFPSQDLIIDYMGKIPPFNELYIAYLDQLKSIWKDDSQLPPIHQNLTLFKVESCCSLVKLAPSSASFQNLWELSVSGCHQLIHLVTISIAKSLVNLKRLKINDCKKIEEIVMNQTNEGVEGGITFNKLDKIELTDMPSLKMFSSQSHTFQFPKLREIKISGCPEMNIFCPGVLETPNLSKVKIEEHDMKWKEKEDLNKTIQMLSSVNV